MPRFRAHVLSIVAFAAPAALAAQPGFVDRFTNAGDIGAWQGGSSAGTIYTNPGTGGVGGANDGYLSMRNPNLGFLGAYSTAVEYQGDWIAAGITAVTFSLRDVGDPHNLEIHFSIAVGQSVVWQYNPGFVPVQNEWRQFTVPILPLDPTRWTRTRGTLSFEQALRNVERVHVRHDFPPFGPSPNAIIGDFAIDEITLVPAPGAAMTFALAAALGLRRRR